MRNFVLAATFAASLSGCCSLDPEYVAVSPCAPAPCGTPVPAAPLETVAPMHANPIFIPIADPQCAWERVADTVDDYFRIEHEEPVRLAGNVATEGILTTVPEVSPTVFEPWRRDTVDPQQRWENTLQSMRRRAVFRVSPAPGGYLVDVQVFKELEDNLHPDHSTAGAATFRYDSSLTGVEDPIGGEPTTKGWIGRGRDTSLEQHMIGNLLARCGQPAQPMVARGPSAQGSEPIRR